MNPTKTEGELGCSGRVISSCSTFQFFYIPLKSVNEFKYSNIKSKKELLDSQLETTYMQKNEHFYNTFKGCLLLDLKDLHIIINFCFQNNYWLFSTAIRCWPGTKYSRHRRLQKRWTNQHHVPTSTYYC